MKAFGIIALLISLVIVAVLAGKQRKAAFKTTALVPSGKEVEITKLPDEVKTELDDFSQQSEGRNDKGQEPE